jgi:hypothetical protein
METGTANPESDSDLKEAMDYILREMCKRDRDSGVPFSFNEIEKFLRASYDQKYLNINLRNLLNGSGLLDIHDDMLVLSDDGRKFCKEILK